MFAGLLGRLSWAHGPEQLPSSSSCTAGDLALREMPSPGKSGSVFFLSQDDKYIIKTMRKVR